MRRVVLREGDTVESISEKHFQKYSKAEKNILEKNAGDLINYGNLISEQGGSFSSKRTVKISEGKALILDARFGVRTIFGRFLSLFRQ